MKTQFIDEDLLDLVAGIRFTPEGAAFVQDAGWIETGSWIRWEEAEDAAVDLLMLSLGTNKKCEPKNPAIFEFVRQVLVAHTRMVGQFRSVN